MVRGRQGWGRDTKYTPSLTIHMSLKSKHSVHVCFFLPSPPGSYYQMTIYSRLPLGKRFHKHQDFKSRKGHDEHGGCMTQFPSWAVYLAAGFAIPPSAKPQALALKFEVQEPPPALGPALQQGPSATAGRGKDSCSLAGRRR